MNNGHPPAFIPKGRVIRAKDVEAWRQGNDYLAAARAEAARIVAEAQTEHARLIAAGQAEGTRAGEAAITKRVAEATRQLDELLNHSEEWLAELVIETVERVIGALDQRSCTLQAAMEALRAFRHARRLVVRVPPDAVGWMEDGLNQALEPSLRTLLVIQPDPVLGEGRCVVTSEFGSVEAGVAEQIAALRDGLRMQRGEDHPHG